VNYRLTVTSGCRETDEDKASLFRLYSICHYSKCFTQKGIKIKAREIKPVIKGIGDIKMIQL